MLPFAVLTRLPWLIDELVCLDEGATAGLADQDLFLLLSTDPFACDDQFDSGNLLCAISWRCNLYRQREESTQPLGNLLGTLSKSFRDELKLLHLVWDGREGPRWGVLMYPEVR